MANELYKPPCENGFVHPYICGVKHKSWLLTVNNGSYSWNVESVHPTYSKVWHVPLSTLAKGL